MLRFGATVSQTYERGVVVSFPLRSFARMVNTYAFPLAMAVQKLIPVEVLAQFKAELVIPASVQRTFQISPAEKVPHAYEVPLAVSDNLYDTVSRCASEGESRKSIPELLMDRPFCGSHTPAPAYVIPRLGLVESMKKFWLVCVVEFPQVSVAVSRMSACSDCVLAGNENVLDPLLARPLPMSTQFPPLFRLYSNEIGLLPRLESDIPPAFHVTVCVDHPDRNAFCVGEVMAFETMAGLDLSTEKGADTIEFAFPTPSVAVSRMV